MDCTKDEIIEENLLDIFSDTGVEYSLFEYIDYLNTLESVKDMLDIVCIHNGWSLRTDRLLCFRNLSWIHLEQGKLTRPFMARLLPYLKDYNFCQISDIVYRLVKAKVFDVEEYSDIVLQTVRTRLDSLEFRRLVLDNKRLHVLKAYLTNIDY